MKFGRTDIVLLYLVLLEMGDEVCNKRAVELERLREEEREKAKAGSAFLYTDRASMTTWTWTTHPR